jgi:N6-L-threonylcarbamoyladenine synthase
MPNWEIESICIYSNLKVPVWTLVFRLKTAILYFIQKKKLENPDFIVENTNDICASIQYTIEIWLMDK